MLLATLCILLSTILTAQPSAAKKLTDLFPRDGLCGLSTEEKLDTLRKIKEFEAADADGQDADGQDADDDGQDADDDADPDDDAGFVTVPQCGAGLWLPIANFDVAGTDIDCPPGWTFTDSPTRGRGALGKILFVVVKVDVIAVTWLLSPQVGCHTTKFVGESLAEGLVWHLVFIPLAV